MGSSQTTTSNQVQTQVANPATQAAVGNVLSYVPGIAATPYSSAMNPQVAALNSQQQAGIGAQGALLNSNPASPFINQANVYSQQAADPNNINAMTQQFYSPMASNVFAQLQNTFGQQNAALKGNEAASGSIGGSRASVADSTALNQEGLATGQVGAQLYQQALSAAQNQQGQIANQAYAQGQLGQESLNTQVQAIQQALQGGQLSYAEAQAQLNALQQSAIQSTLFGQQEVGAAANIAGIGSLLGGTTYGTSQTTQPVSYAGMILGGGLAGLGAMGGVSGVQNLFSSDTPQFGAYGGAIRRADGGSTGDELENYFEHAPQVVVPQSNFPTLDLSPKQSQQQSGSGSSGLGGLASLVKLALAHDGGAIKAPKRRALGGGAGIGEGTTGLLGYSGLSGGLEPYFAQSPKVNIPQSHFPTLSLGQNSGQNSAQAQQDAQTKQMLDFTKLGQGIGKTGIGSDISNYVGQQMYGGELGQDFGGGGADFARGGRIHMRDGGDPTSVQDANDAFLANNQGFGLGLVPPANAAVPSNQWQPSIEAATQKLIQDRLQPSPPEATKMAALSPTPGPGQYTEMGYDGRPIGAPQPSVRDPALVQQAAIASPAQTPPPVASPQPQADQSYYDRLRQTESGGNPNAQSPTSSAFGPYQFTKATWHDDVVVRHPELGLTDQDRLNPAAQERAIPVFTKDRQAALTQVGIEPTNTNTYMAHFLGSAGAAHFLGALKADPKTPADTVANPDQVAANHNVFYNEDGSPKTVGEVYASFNALMSGNGHNAGQQRSGLQDPSLQPPKPGDSYLDRTLAAFGINLNQPQGLGGSLGRAFGQQPSLSDQNSNRLVNLGIGMMSAGPSIGVKGFPGAAISALTSAGKGGQFALNQEFQERQQAIALANAAMSQKLHEAQAAHTQFEMKKPFQIGSSVIYVRDPVTQQLTAHSVTNFGTMDPATGKITPLSQDEVMRLNGISGTKGAPGQQAEAEPQNTSTGEDARQELAQTDPRRMRDVQAILDGRAAVPTGKSRSPNDLINWDWANRISNGQVTAGTYSSIAAAQKKLAAGPWADVQVAANKAVNHATDFVRNLPGLGNTGSGWYNSVTGVTEEQNPWATGYQSALSGVRTNKNGLASEIAKVFKGSGATSEQEINEWKHNFSEYSSPTQQIRAAQESMHMMMGQLDPLASKINEEMHRSPGDKGYITGRDMLSPEFRERFDKIMDMDPQGGLKEIERVFGKGGNSLKQGEAVSKQAAPTSPTVSTKQQYDALPSGSQYIDARDGKIKVKS